MFLVLEYQSFPPHLLAVPLSSLCSLFSDFHRLHDIVVWSFYFYTPAASHRTSALCFSFLFYRPVTHSESSPPWLLPSNTYSTFHSRSPLCALNPYTIFPSFSVHSHTSVLSPLTLHLTHILVNSQSLFPLHLLPTCLPIPENKLKALTSMSWLNTYKSDCYTVRLLAHRWEFNRRYVDI